MYEEFYGFVQSPFTLAPDPRFFYLSESHDEAITRLLQAIRRKEGFIVLTGDIGTGKTTLCRALLEQLDRKTFTSLVLNPFLSVEELLREILLDFGVVSREAVRSGRIAAASKHELLTTLNDFLLSLVPIGGTGVLIIDEAQHLSRQVLEEIRVISNLEANDAKLLQIILVGQLNLLEVLAGADVRPLDQRISLKATLKPLTRGETEAYIVHRLAIARGTSSVEFDRGAVDAIHTVTRGVPRVINLVCDRALMLAARAGSTRIATPFVGQSAEGLSLKRHGAFPTWGQVPGWAVVLGAIVLLAAVALLMVPADRLIDAGMPAPPGTPPQTAAPGIRPRAVPADVVVRPNGTIQPLRPL